MKGVDADRIYVLMVPGDAEPLQGVFATPQKAMTWATAKLKGRGYLIYTMTLNQPELEGVILDSEPE